MNKQFFHFSEFSFFQKGGRHHINNTHRAAGFGHGHREKKMHHRGGGRREAFSHFRKSRKLSAEELQLVLMHFLEKKPTHGYELINHMEKLSNGFYVPSPGMIYPTLTYIVEVGYAHIELEGARKLYHLTVDGLKWLQDREQQVLELITSLQKMGEYMSAWRTAMEEGEPADQMRSLSTVESARRTLKKALLERRNASETEQKRIAALLLKAAKEIVEG